MFNQDYTKVKFVLNQNSSTENVNFIMSTSLKMAYQSCEINAIGASVLPSS